MKWLRAPIVLCLLGPACSLLARDDGYFDGDAGLGGASSTGGGDAGGAAPDPGSAGAGAMSGAMSGAAGSGATSGAAGGASGGTGGASGGAGGSAGEAGASSGGAGESGAGAAGASGANGCSRADACMAGMSETTMQACGACGTGKQSHSHTCSPDNCTWGPWSNWTACAGVTATCTPGDTSPCANGDSCGQRVCSSSCTWGGCTPKVAGGCLRIGEGHSNEGSNYQCCGGRGHWEFCLPDCHWSGDCVSCTEGAPNYCSDCYP